MSCDLDVITKTHLMVNRSTTKEEHFECLLEIRQKSLNIICEGDSWFSYPRENFVLGPPANIIDHLELMAYYNLLRMASPGDEAVGMLTGTNKREIGRLLEKFGNKIDVFLFSGGGNDIVGAGDMDRFLLERRNGSTADGWINREVFDATIKKVENAYVNLIKLRDKYCRECTIITHTYCYPLPSNVGGAFLHGLFKTKAWIKPYMLEKGITDFDDQYAIIKRMIDDFAEMLKRHQSPRFIVLDIRDFAQSEDWLNEIHLTPMAFARVAKLFYDKIEVVRRV